MTDVEVIKNNIREVCKLHTNAKSVLKKANGKLTYLEIAALTKTPTTQCSTVLNKASSLNLVDKIKAGLFKRKKILTGALIDSALKNSGSQTTIKEHHIKVRKTKKVINTTAIKKQILEYLVNHLKVIQHPFADKKDKLSQEKIIKAYEKLIQVLEKDLGVVQIDGLSLRFFNAFSDFLSCSVLNKAELIAAFSSLIKTFEPYIKKMAAIKNNDNKFATAQFDLEAIRNAISFAADIKKRDSDYWKDKEIHEACIRYVYPFRHIEAHEARDYTVFEIHKIIYYMFASIIYININ